MSAPNASRYAAPNVSFQVIPFAIEGIPSEVFVKQSFKAITSNGTPQIGTFLAGPLALRLTPSIDDSPALTLTLPFQRRWHLPWNGTL